MSREEAVGEVASSLTVQGVRSLFGDVGWAGVDRASAILHARYCTTPPVTLAELGSRYGVSGPAIRETEQKALRLLRHPRRRAPLVNAPVRGTRLHLAVFGRVDDGAVER